MATKIQDLEQEFLRCWEITQDLTLIAMEHEDNDEFCNKVLGLKHTYEMRFNVAWKSYEAVVKEHYELRKHLPREVNFD